MANQYKTVAYNAPTANTVETAYTATAATTLVKNVVATIDTGTPTVAVYFVPKSGTPKLLETATLSVGRGTALLVDVVPLTAGDAIAVETTDTAANFVLSILEATESVAGQSITVHSDVDTTGVVDGEVLTYNGATGNWEPAAGGGGGGSVDSVNGYTGTVVLDPDDLDDTSTTNKWTTAADISKLAGIEAGAQVNTVTSVNGETGAVVIQTVTEVVKNVSGGTLVKGTPVHVTGSTGNEANVVAADCFVNYPAHFVLNEDLANGNTGDAVALGFINNVDVPNAALYTPGDTVYLAEAGGWTTTKPVGADTAVQRLGVILKVNTSGNKISGVLFGLGMDEQLPNLGTGNVWLGDANGGPAETELTTTIVPEGTGLYFTNTRADARTIEGRNIVITDNRTLDIDGNNFTVADSGGTLVDFLGFSGAVKLTAVLQLAGISNATGGRIQFYEGSTNGTNYVEFRAADSLTATTIYTLPTADGAADEVLTTDGAGQLSWEPPTPQFFGVVTTAATAYTLAATDAGKYIVFTASTAVTVTVPADTLAVADEVLIEQRGTGQITVNAGTGTSIATSASNTNRTAEQYAVVGLKCVGTNTWTLTGERELV
jgi:hypothetical protein